MPIELKIPEVGESITEVEVGGWLKKTGDPVRKDEGLVTLESEKATMELPAPDSGTITQILQQKGDTAKVSAVIANWDQGTAASIRAEPAEKKPSAQEISQTAPARQVSSEPRVRSEER